MCGIIAFFDLLKKYQGNPEKLKERLTALGHLMRTRGPDSQGYHGGKYFGMAHQRLAIMDPLHGDQPFVYEEQGYALVANGEIYNFQELISKHNLPQMQTHSDCEPLIALYDKLGNDMVKELNGMFGFVISKNGGEEIYAARDHCGIKPLYIGYGKEGEIWFSSELKGIVNEDCEKIEEFPAGHYWTRSEGFRRYYQPAWDHDYFEPKGDCSKIKKVLEQAVRDQCMSDQPFGLLLSGGLDSACIAVLLKPVIQELGEEFHTFSVGMEGSPDITAARMMSKFLGTTHHEHLFNADEAFEHVEKVIYHLETYEPELIRSAIPNYFLARMTSQYVKMVLTGEGSDELFGGYLYFRDAPDSRTFHRELRRIFHHLHNVNCQRADRMTMAHALEARVPFLCPNVIEAIMNIDPSFKTITKERPAEKHALRAAFEGTMPSEVLWRTKAMQCEGIGMTWVAELQSRCNRQISDEEFARRDELYPINTPVTKEEMYYRKIFEKYYKGMDKFVQVWDGGCRAGGAAWKTTAYTREGLRDVKQLARGLGIDTNHVDEHSEKLANFHGKDSLGENTIQI